MKRPSRARSLFHLSGAAIPVIYLMTDRRTVLFVTVPALVAAALLDVLRIKGHIRLAFARPLLKEKETRGPTGSLFYLISCALTIILFDRLAAAASIFVLAVSDPLSTMVGSRWGRTVVHGKSLEGAAAFFFSSFLILLLFSFGPPAAIAAAAAGTATEFFSPAFIDDNLTIPLVIALTLTLLAG
jgi:dolichol kinase